MSVVPGATPVIRPEAELIVAVVSVPEVHTPPATPAGLLSRLVPAGQLVAVPVIVPATGNAVTVTIRVAEALPQLLVTV